VLAVFGLARVLGGSRSQAAFAGLLWATFPEVVLQSTTTQNDLLIAALSAASLYFLYRSVSTPPLGRTEARPDLFLSSLALALAVGTKHSALFMGPGLAVALLLLWLRGRGAALRQLLAWGAAGLVAFALAGAYAYVVNLGVHGHPLGDTSVGENLPKAASVAGSLKIWATNLSRYLYQAVDFSGLPYLALDRLQTLKGNIANQALSFLGIPIQSGLGTKHQMGFSLYDCPPLHEDGAWFGPVSVLLLVPCAFVQLWVGARKKDPVRLGIVAMVVVFFLTAAAAMSWSPWRGRFFLFPATICAAFMAPVLGRGRGLRVLQWVVVLLAVFVLGRTVLFNRAKPLAGEGSIWGKDRVARLAINWPRMEAPLRMVEERVPRDAELGTVLSLNSWDYPYFGEGLTRRLTSILPVSRFGDAEWLIAQGFEYVVVLDRAAEGVTPAPVLELMERVDRWSLYRVGAEGANIQHPTRNTQ